MNDQNLRPFNTRTESEQREIARMGGLASAASKQRQAAFRDVVATVLDLKATLTDSERSYYERLGLDADDITVRMKMVLKMVSAAMNGDVRAFTCLRDTVGEKPNDKGSSMVGLMGDFEIVLGDEPAE